MYNFIFKESHYYHVIVSAERLFEVVFLGYVPLLNYKFVNARPTQQSFTARFAKYPKRYLRILIFYIFPFIYTSNIFISQL